VNNQIPTVSVCAEELSKQSYDIPLQGVVWLQNLAKLSQIHTINSLCLVKNNCVCFKTALVVSLRACEVKETTQSDPLRGSLIELDNIALITVIT
jgi:hypothetical protein